MSTWLCYIGGFSSVLSSVIGLMLQWDVCAGMLLGSTGCCNVAPSWSHVSYKQSFDINGSGTAVRKASAA